MIPVEPGVIRYKIKLSRLPNELYPMRVDGAKISGQAIQRFYSLEKRLDHPRNSKLRSGVHTRVETLIEEGMLIPTGYWIDHQDDFLQDQEQGKEKILIPWQTVIDHSKAMEHSQIRMCLDGTESNKLIYKIDTESPDIRDILMRWKTANKWICIDIRQMFWSILTHGQDADLQHCVWRSHKDDKLMLYKFCRMVMGLSNSPGLARLVLLHNAKENAETHPDVYKVMHDNTYMDDSGIFGNNDDEVSRIATQVVDCLRKGSFKSGKILSDSRAALNAVPKDAIHPSIQKVLDGEEKSVKGIMGTTVQFKHPTIEDAVVKDAKQLGVHFEMDLDREESNLTYDHWWESHDPNVLTKKMVARGYARAWNPLQEMGPIINPGKVCLSKIWSLQSFLQKRKVQTTFDFKEKGNYRPLANRKEANKPTD